MPSLFKIATVGVIVAVLTYFLRQYNQGRTCDSTDRLDNKVAIVTGANVGLGKETSLDFIQRGAKVIMACRSIQKAEAAAQEILSLTKAPKDKLVVMHLDLGSMKSIRKFAQEFKSREKRLDILMNNAGVMWIPYAKTEDGFEMQVGVNHLGHFLLTNLLSDLLIKSSPSRVVTVSSLAHRFTYSIAWDTLNAEEGEYSRMDAYAQAKLANILFSRELGKKLDGTGVTTYSLHPGTVATEMQRYVPGMDNNIGKRLWRFVGWPFFKDPWQGTQTQICCAVDKKLEKETGKYYSDVQEATPSVYASNDEDAKKLWEWSAEMVKLTEAETHPKLR